MIYKMKKNSQRDGLDKLIVALCRDYRRRSQAIASGSVSRRVRMEYAYLNARILEGAGEIVGSAMAEEFVNDIGDSIGYAYTALTCLGEATYKRYKQEVKENIARRLYLCD